jgi:mannose-6-phosphate isomerase-like protein (cupin superfamily)
MTSPRPSPVGTYEILQDFEAPEVSIRVIKMSGTGQSVGRHIHHRSTQVYIALQGRTTVDRNGELTHIEPYQTVVVAPETIHAAFPDGQSSIVMNISMPPLQADDQVPVPRFEASAAWGRE